MPLKMKELRIDGLKTWGPGMSYHAKVFKLSVAVGNQNSISFIPVPLICSFHNEIMSWKVTMVFGMSIWAVIF